MNKTKREISGQRFNCPEIITNKLIATILVCAIITIILFCFYYQIVSSQVLILNDVDADKRTTLVVHNGVFVLSYIHSAHKTPVFEFFDINDYNNLVLFKTVYESLGIGLPFTEENGNLSMENGKYILNMKKEFSSIYIRVSPIAHHSINIGGEDYPLLKYVGPNNLLKITAKKQYKLKKKR
ncbi:MAG: DUF1850 domain-containing protein [Clostridiaceae bacterium]|nr:DUF1850 domain-containing protein [Clostridiaceae bacterium]